MTASTLLDALPARPRILGLGEPTHGENALLDLRNDLIRRLVEEHGYRTVAVESHCLRGRLIDTYVTTGAGDLDDVVARGLTHDFGTFAGNHDLVRWMHAHNAGRAAAEQVRFAGFDGPLEIDAAESPREALTGLHAFVAARLDAGLLPCTAETLDALLGDDGRWTDPAVMFDAARSVGRTPDAVRLRLLADDLAALCDAHAPHLIATSDADGWELARLHARTALGLLRYHDAMADPTAYRMGRLLAVRDSMMAANLLALADRGPVLVSAHNLHLQRHPGRMPMNGVLQRWWSAGAIVGARLGADYAFVAGAVGTIRHRGVDTPPPDTVEGLLHARGDDRQVLDRAGLAALLADVKPAVRTSPWYGYFPLEPEHLDGVDGLTFVRDSTG